MSDAEGRVVDLQEIADRVQADIKGEIGAGRVADYIPDLANVDPHQAGIAIAPVDGPVITSGDANTKFSMQSISKIFTLALVLHHDNEQIWTRVHREPSGMPFNSLIELELENGIPRNPFINPGAIAVTDQLLTNTGDAFATLRGFLRAETGDPDLHVDGVTADSESRAGHRNRAAAHLMADFGNMNNPVDEPLQHYFQQCSMTISCTELANAGLLLARHGKRADGSQFLSVADARRIMSIMLTCGTYDEAGEFAYEIGLPCKSGVGGGILAIVPGVCSVAVWGPGLDPKGNSVSGKAALNAFVKHSGYTVF